VARRHDRPEEIMAKLREAEVLLGRGKKVPEVVKELGIHEVTYYRGMQARSQIDRLSIAYSTGMLSKSQLRK